METFLVLAACASGCVFGWMSGEWLFHVHARARLENAMRSAAGVLEGEVLGAFACEGTALAVLRFTLWLSQRSEKEMVLKLPCHPVLVAGSSSFGRLLWMAGMAELCAFQDLIAARACLCIGAGCAGVLVGAVFSWQLMVLLGIVGAGLGFAAVPWALKQEALARSRQVEGELSQMLDVMVLGLRSGLSFQRALDLYCQHFDTALGAAFMGAIRRWEWGLSDRDAALKSLAASYDSPLLTRSIDGMVRSIRFGTSIADVLEDISADARELHKARVEEQVAKAPVKMMLPIGTLVLPAMLLIVLGPVLLELMEGF